MGIMRRFLTIDEQLLSAACDFQLAALNSCKRLERCTGRAATIRAVTIKGISELVFNFILDRAAQALATQGAQAGSRYTGSHILQTPGLGVTAQDAGEGGGDLARLQRLGEQLADTRDERLSSQGRAVITAHQPDRQVGPPAALTACGA